MRMMLFRLLFDSLPDFSPCARKPIPLCEQLFIVLFYFREAKTKPLIFIVSLLTCLTGRTPYPGVDNRDIYPLVQSGYRMEKPSMCSDEL